MSAFSRWMLGPLWLYPRGGAAARRGRSTRRRPRPSSLPPACGEPLEARTVLAGVTPAPLVSLLQDTGASQTDRITRVGTLAVTAVDAASVEYSIDGGKSWSTTFAPQSGLNKLLVRQTAPGGQPSATTAFSFTLDNVAPAPLALALKADTGGSGNDLVTRDGTLSFVIPVTKKTSVEAGATVEYWNGSNWGSSFVPVEGLNTVNVRQVDRAGNASEESSLVFTLDKTLPVAPGVSLKNDTNVPDDRITSDGTLLTATTDPGAVEATATVQYSTDGGRTWAGRFVPKSGANGVLVRQVDLAGNASAATSFTFTFDAIAPAKPQISLAADTGTSKTDRITADGTLSLANPATKKSSIENAAFLEYSVLQPDSGTWTDWSASFAAVEGVNTVKARQSDRAGNVSPESAPLLFTLVRQPPTIAAVAAPGAATYLSGQPLVFAVTYSRAVTVSPLAGGTAVPYLDLDIGGSGRRATYAGGSGTTTLLFRATVAAGTSGVVSVAGSIGLPPNAFIRDLAGNAAATTFTPPDTSAVLVDAVVPTASMTFDPAAQSATIVFSRPVTGVDIQDFRIRGSIAGTKFNLPLTDPLVINQVGDVTLTGAGARWTLAVESLPPGNGAFTLVLVASGSGIFDAIGNPLLGDASVSVTR